MNERDQEPPQPLRVVKRAGVMRPQPKPGIVNENEKKRGRCCA